MKIGLIDVRQYNKEYKEIIKKLKYKATLFDIYKDDWVKNLESMDKKIDVYFWQSIDRGRFYREAILDKVYFIEKYSTKKIFPDFNQYYTFNDKVKQLFLFQKYRIPNPKTFYTTDRSLALDFIKQIKYPFVLKDPHSSSGLGVYLIKTKKQAKEILGKIFSNSGFNSLYNQFYAQEFIPNLDRSLRVITIGSKVFCAYWRINPDDWKINLGPKTYVTDKGVPKKALKICQDISRKLNIIG